MWLKYAIHTFFLFLVLIFGYIIEYVYLLGTKYKLYFYDDVYILETKMLVDKEFIESMFAGEYIKFDFDNLDVYSYYFLK